MRGGSVVGVAWMWSGAPCGRPRPLVGIVPHWRWLFWLLLVAFGCMVLEIPATVLQLTGVLPNLFPVWYSLCRVGVAIIAVLIATWMARIYRHHGVWAMGKKKKT